CVCVCVCEGGVCVCVCVCVCVWVCVGGCLFLAPPERDRLLRSARGRVCEGGVCVCVWMCVCVCVCVCVTQLLYSTESRAGSEGGGAVKGAAGQHSELPDLELPNTGCQGRGTTHTHTQRE